MSTARAEKFCSHCQKERPMSSFIGINRSKGPKNGKPEELKTCEECRIKVAKQKQAASPSTPVATPRQTIAPSGFRPVNGDSVRRNLRRIPGQPTFVHVERIETGKQAASVAELAATQSTPVNKVTERKSVSPVPPLSKKRTRTDLRASANGASISGSPPPSKRGRAERVVELDQSEHESEEHMIDNGDSADDGEPERFQSFQNRCIMAKELLEFAQGLERLGGLLYTALEELDDQTVQGLQCELRHDWRVEEMGTFVEGYLKGATKRNKGGSGW
ncbi:hypothetical protein K440DRAFT_643286 [Wilcoxina mikolae CBS 423.85]|nr:hypothetical protein K440DRAFT_643286 [Wilcoxina mikolae CBS 423.85]